MPCPMHLLHLVFPSCICCTRIAESHQTPQEPRIDAKAVRNFITSSSRDSLHTMAREPRMKTANLFYTVQQGKREGKLRGLANSSCAAGEAGSLGGVRLGWGTLPPFLDCLGVEGNLSPSDWLVWKSFFFFSYSREGFSLRMAVPSKMELFWIFLSQYPFIING